MNTNKKNFDWGFWLAWVLASVLGFIMGAVLGTSIAYRFFNRDPFDTIMGITLGTVMGATGGYFQWVVLRERIAGAGLWWLASALGFGSAMGALDAANAAANDAIAGLLIGSVFGVVTGLLQWLILRRKVARARLWLLANILGSLIGAIAILIAAALGDAGNWLLAIILFGLVFGAGNGAITGVALAWLLRQSPSANFEGMATVH